MKANSWVWGGLAWLAAASLLAQDSTGDSKPPAAPRRSGAGAVARHTVLDPPGAADVKIETLLVRSRPAFAGNVLLNLKRGQPVTVLEQITLAKPELNEPTNWARIVLPTNAPVWVFARYVDTNEMKISGSRVSVRSGADDIYDRLAVLEKGAPVTVVRRLSDWIQIQPPTNAFGWVAADYLTMLPTPVPPPSVAVVPEPAVPTPPVPAPETNVPVAAVPAPSEPIAAVPATNLTAEATNTAAIAASAPNPNSETTNTTPSADAALNPQSAIRNPQSAIRNPQSDNPQSAIHNPQSAAPPPIIAPEPVASAPEPLTTNSTPAPAPTPLPAPKNLRISAEPAKPAPVPATTPATGPAPKTAANAEFPGIDTNPRIVAREGLVRKALNIQAPADYELRDINSGTVIEYLQPDAGEKNFKKYTGARVLVSGPEWLDRRWPKTPILQIQTIDFMP
jgi:hypothetical protein